MIHDSKLSRFALTALPLCAALSLACGGGEDDGAAPTVPGSPGAGAPVQTPPGTGPDGATQQPGETPDPAQPGGSGEEPVTNGGTPLEPGAGDPGAGDPGAPQNPPPRSDGVVGTRNLFTELLGVSEAEVDQKVQTAVNRFFGIGTGEPATPANDGGARSFYTLPQDPSMGFVYALDSTDIRSEGMSYGMFIALQMNMQQEFDQLWRFARTFMQYAPDGEPASWRRYFRWTGRVDTSDPNNWPVTYNATEPPAPDGEEYFAAALYLADRRWGSAGEINYEEEADAIATAMLHNEPGADGRFPIFHQQQNMVTFVPYGTSYEFSDPSYHLPHFYEIFAQDGPAEDAARWLEIAEISRQYFVDSAHPETGLHPDYANFDGSPSQGFQASDHDQFRFDAWRVPMNMAVDYAWSGEDPRLLAQLEKYYGFFGANQTNGSLTASLYLLDGSGGTNGNSAALLASLASGALATTGPNQALFVNSVWTVAQPTGLYRYYNGAVYLLGLLATAGYYDFLFPQ